MNNLGLTKKQIEERRSYIGAGDAKRIWEGDWNSLWREKMGFATPVDLSSVMKVQLGSYTEPFNLAWFREQTGRAVEYYSGNKLMRTIWKALTGLEANPNEMVAHDEFAWMRCNLDAVSTTAGGTPMVLDAKHVGRADEPMIMRYTPAGTHQALVCGTDWWGLSVIVGNGVNDRLEIIEQEVDLLFAEELVAKEREFWGYVERGEEPSDPGAEVVPKPQKVLRKVQLFEEFKADWPNWAPDMLEEFRVFRTTLEASRLHAITRDNIKGLLPDDVGEVTSPTVRVSRSKAGSITIAPTKGDTDA